MIFYKNINEITSKDIEELISNEIIENKHLEYKEKLPDDSQSAKSKFLATIVSFANSDGGLLIFGLSQNKAGAADKVIGIVSESTDQDFLRLQQIIQSGIEPRINPLNIREIVVDGKRLYLLKTDKSLRLPHRVIHNQKFYGRNASGRYELDISELRNLFLFSNNIKERVEKFVLERIIRIKSGNFPFDFIGNKIIVLHLIPMASLVEDFILSLRGMEPILNRISPIETSSCNHIYNYDGRMNYFISHNKQMASYVQIFRNGIIESVNAGILNIDRDNTIRGPAIENTIRNNVVKYIEASTNMGIGYPFFIHIAFLNIKGSRIVAPNTWSFDLILNDFGGIYQNDLLLPLLYIEADELIEKNLNYGFDVFWNASGFSRRSK